MLKEFCNFMERKMAAHSSPKKASSSGPRWFFAGG
jgi:hypothetical protein